MSRRPSSPVRPRTSSTGSKADESKARRGGTEADLAVDPASSDNEGAEHTTVVDARDRFAHERSTRVRLSRAVLGAPWQRRRRYVLASVAGIVALTVGVIAVLAFVPALQVNSVNVEGASYVDATQVQSAAEGATGKPLAFVSTGRIERDVEAVPGVAHADVARTWPNQLTITVTEREPAAQVQRADGSTEVRDASAAVLPAQAGADQDLLTLVVKPDARDEEGAIMAMLAASQSLPADLRAQVTTMTASSGNDVTFTVNNSEGETKTVVWGDASDSELKAQVVAVLVEEPGIQIDVTSPVAPVTR